MVDTVYMIKPTGDLILVREDSTGNETVMLTEGLESDLTSKQEKMILSWGIGEICDL